MASHRSRWDPVGAYRQLLERAAAEPDVVGVVAFGSRAAGVFVTEQSDVDCFVVVDGPESAADRWATNHGESVEVWPLTLDAFRLHAMPGTAQEWNRPAFIRARVDLDKLDGEIARIVERKRRLTPAEAETTARDAIDDAINAIYRARRNVEAGRDLEGRLDAVQAIGPFLTAAFALDERVRPFNKWLRRDLSDEPLRATRSSSVLEIAEELAGKATQESLVAALSAAFVVLEDAARSRGHGERIDGWEPDVAWLRQPRP
jgi:hypothetical protein